MKKYSETEKESPKLSDIVGQNFEMTGYETKDTSYGLRAEIHIKNHGTYSTFAKVILESLALMDSIFAAEETVAVKLCQDPHKNYLYFTDPDPDWIPEEPVKFGNETVSDPSEWGEEQPAPQEPVEAPVEIPVEVPKMEG
jgi:hypothetical protein